MSKNKCHIELESGVYINLTHKKGNKNKSIEYTNKHENIKQITLGNFNPNDEEMVKKDIKMKYAMASDFVEFTNSIINFYRSRKTYKDKYCIDFLNEEQYFKLMNVYKELNL